MITTTKIYYRSGYKYQLAHTYWHPLPWYKGPRLEAEFLILTPAESRTGAGLYVLGGYAWDGPSGPTIDTANAMRGSLVHDALYQLMRYGALPQSTRKAADDEFRRILRADGMSAARAWLWYHTVRPAAGFAAEEGSDGGHPLVEAP
jgi:hypothetical protein